MWQCHIEQLILQSGAKVSFCYLENGQLLKYSNFFFHIPVSTELCLLTEYNSEEIVAKILS